MNDVILYRELLKRGVSEYLIAPVTLEKPEPRNERPKKAAAAQLDLF